MQTWKVIAAFVGVFVAGAVFGGFFTLGVASRTGSFSPPVGESESAASTDAAAEARSAGAKEAGRDKRPAGGGRSLLQIPQTWQAPQLMRRYAERLDLTPEQKQRINPLFQRAAEDYRRVQQNTYREAGVILNRLQQDLAQELTPEQRAKLDAWQRDQRERLRKVEQRFKEQRRSFQKAKDGEAPGGDSEEKRDAGE